jgi:hypothetical protein
VAARPGESTPLRATMVADCPSIPGPPRMHRTVPLTHTARLRKRFVGISSSRIQCSCRLQPA